MKQDYDVRVLRSHGIDRRWVISVISVSSTVTNVGGADDGRWSFRYILLTCPRHWVSWPRLAFEWVPSACCRRHSLAENDTRRCELTPVAFLIGVVLEDQLHAMSTAVKKEGFFELKSKAEGFEKALRAAKKEIERLVEERHDAERKESKYRAKQKRAKENLSKRVKEFNAIQKEKLALETECEHLKEELEAEVEAHASDLEDVEERLLAKDRLIARLKKTVLLQKEKLNNFEALHHEIEKNKLAMQAHQVQLKEKSKADVLREQLMRQSFQTQVRDALLIGQEQGREQERQRNKILSQQEWKKLLEKEKEFDEADEDFKQMTAAALAVEARQDGAISHNIQRVLSATLTPSSRVFEKGPTLRQSNLQGNEKAEHWASPTQPAYRKVINADYNAKRNQFNLKEPLSLDKLAEIKSLLQDVRERGRGSAYFSSRRKNVESVKGEEEKLTNENTPGN